MDRKPVFPNSRESLVIQDVAPVNVTLPVGQAAGAEWAMSVHAHSCTSLYLDTDTSQLALNPTVSH